MGTCYILSMTSCSRYKYLKKNVYRTKAKCVLFLLERMNEDVANS